MMYNQASKLEELVKKKHQNKNKTSNDKNVKVYCVTSGKGGVGKTNISVNLALVLQELGNKVLLIDADLGLANIDIITGMYPKYDLSHILSEGKSISEVLLQGPLGITILPGASGLCDLADISMLDLNILINAFSGIAENFDILIIDTSAGISKNVLNFVRSADEAIVVTTLEPSSITDAYAIIKLIYKNVDKINIIVNRTSNSSDADFTAEKLLRVSNKYLGIDLAYLGFLFEDKAVNLSNMAQTPFYLKYPNSCATKCIKSIGSKLTGKKSSLSKGKTTFTSWFQKIMSFIVKKPGGKMF